MWISESRTLPAAVTGEDEGLTVGVGTIARVVGTGVRDGVGAGVGAGVGSGTTPVTSVGSGVGAASVSMLRTGFRREVFTFSHTAALFFLN